MGSTSSETSAIGVTDAFFKFHWTNFKKTGIDGRLARESETSFYPSNIRVISQQPRRPSSNSFRFRTGVQVANGILDSTAGTIGSTILREWTVTGSSARTETTTTRGGTFGPVSPLGPLAVDRRRTLDRARRIAGTVNFVTIGTNTKTTAKGRFGIAARPTSCLDSQTTRLRTSRPG